MNRRTRKGRMATGLSRKRRNTGMELMFLIFDMCVCFLVLFSVSIFAERPGALTKAAIAQAYNFGESEKIPKSMFKSRLEDLITSNQSPTNPLYLVFHDNSQDIKYMKSQDAPLDDLSYLLPDSGIPTVGLFVVDTSDLFGALSGSAQGQRKSLEKTCRMLGIETKFLHNAGNDAYVSGSRSLVTEILSMES
jgi:hypothetical protein